MEISIIIRWAQPTSTNTESDKIILKMSQFFSYLNKYIWMSIYLSYKLIKLIRVLIDMFEDLSHQCFKCSKCKFTQKYKLILFEMYINGAISDITRLKSILDEIIIVW